MKRRLMLIVAAVLLVAVAAYAQEPTPAPPKGGNIGVLVEGKGGTPSGFAYKERFVDQTITLDNGVASISGGGGGESLWEAKNATTLGPKAPYTDIQANLNWSYIQSKPFVPARTDVENWAKALAVADLQGSLPWARVSGVPSFVKAVQSASDPTATDDKNAVGDLWVNTTSKDGFICVSNAAGAAVWKKITGAAGETYWFEDPNDPDGIYCDKQTVTMHDVYADTLEAVTDVDGVIFPLGRSKVGGQMEGSILFDDRVGSPTEGKFLFGEADIDENVVIDTIPDTLNELNDVEAYTNPGDGATLKWKTSEKKWMVSPPADSVGFVFEMNWRYQDIVIFVWLVVLTVLAVRRRRA